MATPQYDLQLLIDRAERLDTDAARTTLIRLLRELQRLGNVNNYIHLEQITDDLDRAITAVERPAKALDPKYWVHQERLSGPHPYPPICHDPPSL